MPDRKPSWERRQSPRAEIPATAELVVRRRSLGTYAVKNLSAGGALLTGAPPMEPGSAALVILHLPGMRRPVTLSARAVRSHGADALAVAFNQPAAAVQDVIQNRVLSYLERERRLRAASRRTILVVDDCVRVRHALARALASFGCDVATTGTPREAIRVLDAEHATVHTAVVDLFLDRADGLELLAYLARAHVNVRRVLMSGHARPCQLDLALQHKQAHAVLPKPWRREDLARIVPQ